MQLARAKTSLLNQKPDVAILWEILRSDDLTNEAKYTFLFQSFNFFFPDVPCKCFFQDTFGRIPKSSR